MGQHLVAKGEENYMKVRELGSKCDSFHFYFLQGYSRDDCDTSGCFFELSIQLIVVMCGKQWLNNIVELIIP